MQVQRTQQITMRGNWSFSNETFKRCSCCGGIAVNGVCHTQLQVIKEKRKAVLKSEMEHKAKSSKGFSHPLITKDSPDGFTEYMGMVIYWYNDTFGSTHAIRERIAR